jgi:hypothetical protein
MTDDQSQIDSSTEGGFLLEHERELLKHQAETLRTFYSLTGAPRKDYTIQMAEAEAERIRIIRAAEAQGILAIRQAEAEGLKLIGEAFAAIKQPELVIKLISLEALQKVAQSLGDGKATKLFLPQNLGEIFSLLGSWKDLTGARNDAPSGQQTTTDDQSASS